MMIVLWICIIPMGPLLSLSAFIHKKNIIFGVSFPVDVRKNLAIQKLKKRYVWYQTILGFLLCLPITVLMLVVPFTEEQLGRIYYLYVMITMFGMIFYSQWLHGVYYKKLKAMKRDEFGMIPVKPKAMIHGVTTEESTIVSNDLLLGFGVLILVATIFFAGSQYENIPDVIYLWGEIEKSPALFVIAPITQVVVLFTMTYFNSALGKLKRVSEQNSAYRYAFSKYMITTTLMTLLMLLGMQCLFVFGEAFKVIFWIITAASIVHGVAGVIYLFLKYGQSGERYIPSQVTPKREERVFLDEDDYWIWGLYYYNPGDPSLWVEVRTGGIGITNNWAHRSSKGLFVVFLIIIMIATVLPLFLM